MSLLPLKLKQRTRPIAPTWRPAYRPSRQVAPRASDASSITGTPWRAAAAITGSRGAGGARRAAAGRAAGGGPGAPPAPPRAAPPPPPPPPPVQLRRDERRIEVVGR